MTDHADLLLLAVRASLAAVFLYSAADKLMHPESAVKELQVFNLPLGLRVPVIALQLAGGLSVLFGLYTSIGALALAAFTTAATLIAHRCWLPGPQQGRQITIALEHLGIVGGLVLLALTGPGALSLDRALFP